MRVLAALLVVGVAAVAPAPPPPLFDGVRLGPHAVGFAREVTGDLTVDYWYPAKAGGATRTLRDYLGAVEEDLAGALADAGARPAETARFLGASMRAVTGAPREPGSFPLVLVAQGNGQGAADQAVLCEYLASHGFVVVTTPWPTLAQPMASEADVPLVADRQARELEAAAAAVARHGGLNAAPIAVIGHSFGARSALLLAMRDPRIDRIVSLDGGIGTATAADAFRHAPGWNAAVRVRILHLFERRDAFMAPDFGLLDSLPRATVEKVETHNLGHVHFTTLGFGAAAFPSIASATHAGNGIGPELRGVVSRILAFLQVPVTPARDTPFSTALVRVPPGRFMMGSPAAEPQRGADETAHEVILSHAFMLGAHEVTQDEWRQVMGTSPSHFAGCGNCPVERVSYIDVERFLDRINAHASRLRYRLPTEAEWEYACRAGTTTAFSTGMTLRAADANFNGNYPYAGAPRALYREATTPVAIFPPNPWGLYDMHGNVWEWVADWYGPYPAGPANDPHGPRSGTRRVIRGGSWYFDANSARCALRYTHRPQDSGFSLGFRVAADAID